MLVGRVFEGVRDLGGFAEAADTAAVPGADDDGGDGGEEDVAGDMLVEELRGKTGWEERLEWWRAVRTYP